MSRSLRMEVNIFYSVLCCIRGFAPVHLLIGSVKCYCGPLVPLSFVSVDIARSGMDMVDISVFKSHQIYPYHSWGSSDILWCSENGRIPKTSFPGNVFLVLRWRGVSIQERWRNQQFSVNAGDSSHLLAFLQGSVNGMLGLTTSSCLRITNDYGIEDDTVELYTFKLTSLLSCQQTDPRQLVACGTWFLEFLLLSAMGICTGAYSLVSFSLLSGNYPSPLFKKGWLISKHQIPMVLVVWLLHLATSFSVGGSRSILSLLGSMDDVLRTSIEF